MFGATMAPGFVPTDYEGGDGDALAAAYPERAELIHALWRPGTPRSSNQERSTVR